MQTISHTWMRPPWKARAGSTSIVQPLDVEAPVLNADVMMPIRRAAQDIVRHLLHPTDTGYRYADQRREVDQEDGDYPGTELHADLP